MPEQASSTVAPLRVGVVEDQPLYRDMIVGLLRAQSDVAVPLVASGAADARSQFFPGLLDVVILDVYLHDGNGLALGVSLRRADPNIGILLLSSHDVMELLLDLPSDVTGGWSYLSKTSTLSTDVVLSTLRAAARGETVVDPTSPSGRSAAATPASRSSPSGSTRYCSSSRPACRTARSPSGSAWPSARWRTPSSTSTTCSSCPRITTRACWQCCVSSRRPHGMTTDRLGASDDVRGVRSAGGVLLIVAGTVGFGFGMGAAGQTFALQLVFSGHPETAYGGFLLRVAVNLVTVLVALAAARWSRLVGMGPATAVRTIAAIAVGSGALRAFAQWLLGIQIQRTWGNAAVETMSGALVTALAFAVGMVAARLLLRLRDEERRRVVDEKRAADALEALQAEEARIRREVVDGLQGGVQDRLVDIDRRLAEIAGAAAAAAPASGLAVAVEEVRDELGATRNLELRELLVLLYPEGLELGLVHAVRILLRRVPATISVALEIDPELNGLLLNTTERMRRRLLILRVVEEALSNALRHGRATRLRLALDLEGWGVRIAFDDDGVGMPAAPELRGLALLRERVEAEGGWLEIEPSAALGGTRLTAYIPGAPGERAEDG